MCQSAIIKKCSYYTQNSACNAFIKLIELFRDHELKLTETLTNFVDSDFKAFITYEKKGKYVIISFKFAYKKIMILCHSIIEQNFVIERRLVFRIFGKIIKYKGNVCPSRIYLKSIFQQLLSDVEQVKLIIISIVFIYLLILYYNSLYTASIK